MKKKILSLLALLCMAVTGYSVPYEVQIGEGTSTTGYFPFYTLYNYCISENLFLASELTEAGVVAGPITSLSWYATNETGYEQQDISIWMANVSDTELTTSSHLATGMTQVYTNGTVTPVIGWNEFQCNGDFSWDGTSNLLILVQRNNGEWNSTVSWQATSGLSFTCMSYRYQDSGAYDVTASNTMYTSQTRANIIIKGESGVSFNLTKGETEHGEIAFTNAKGNTISEAYEGQTVTVTITPEEGWAGEPVGQWIAAVAAARNRTSGTSDIGLLSNFELTPVENQENTWTFKMQRANAEISATYKKVIQASWIQDITAVTYNGTGQTPTVTVKDGTTTLVENTDYTVSYSNNVNAALSTATTNAPTVTITAVATSDKYAGTATKTFTINKAALTVKADDKTVTFGDEAPTYTVTYEGFKNGETETVLSGTLAFACEYVKNESGVGEYTITPSGLTSDNYTITFTAGKLTVEKKALESSMIADIPAVTYTGTAQTPTVTVKDGTTTLTKDVDYTVSYTNNVNAALSTATTNAPTVTITGIGNYAGMVKKTFTINKAECYVTFTVKKVTKYFGDPDFTITPEVIGVGTLEYSSNLSPVAKVNESTGEVTILTTGKAAIIATISGSSNYATAFDSYLLVVEPRPVDYEGGTVTQDENGYTVNLTEDAGNPNPNPLPGDEDLVELTYSRTLTAPGSSEGDVTIDDQPANLYTICLPFAPETGDAAKYYTLSSVSGETLNFDEVAAPVANTPYLVAVMGNVNFIESCTDQDVASMTINSSTVDGYTFNGTFAGMTNAEAQGKYILQAGNKWGKVTAENTGAFIPPFRAFIEGPASGARLLAGSIGGDGNTTGIKYIHTQDSNGSEQWYDLNGRRIERPTQNGIYIHNGRKEVLK